jgi:hypothetical protein
MSRSAQLSLDPHRHQTRVKSLHSLVEEPKDERPIQDQLLQPQLDIDPQGLFDVEQPDGVVLRDLAGVFAHRYRLGSCFKRGRNVYVRSGGRNRDGCDVSIVLVKNEMWRTAYLGNPLKDGYGIYGHQQANLD